MVEKAYCDVNSPHNLLLRIREIQDLSEKLEELATELLLDERWDAVSPHQALEIATIWCKEQNVVSNKEFWNSFLFCIADFKKRFGKEPTTEDDIIQCAVMGSAIPKIKKICGEKKLIKK